MSLVRLMLRTRTVSALLQQAYDIAAPTIAGDAVFDTKIEDIEFEKDQIEVPLIAVYTDDDENEILDRGTGHGNYLRIIDLRIEMAVGSFQKIRNDGSTTIRYALPHTDPELEAVLDMFESQVWRALYTPNRAASISWASLVRRVELWRSLPQRSAEGNNRLAARTLLLRCVVPNDCMPRAAVLPDSGKPPEIPTIPSLESAPWLNDMLGTLAKDPAYSGLLDLLREPAGAPSVYLPRLKRMGVALDSVDHYDPSLLAALKRTTGPDGRAEVQATWTVPE